MTILGKLGDNIWEGDIGYGMWSPGLNFVDYVLLPNSMSVLHFILVDFNFGWWLTILGMVGDHPGDRG